MPVGEMCKRMSAYELTVSWPLFLGYEEREAERREQAQAARPPAAFA